MPFGLFGPTPYTPEKDTPDLSGKTILITGANSGLGKEQLRFLAKHGGKSSKLYLAARSQERAQAAISDLESSAPGSKINFLELDLSSLASVKAAAEAFKRDNNRLDILVNNAGIMALPAGLTKDGYEIQFGTNHVGHFLFTKELMPLLEKTAAEPESDVRIVNLSSFGHNFAPKPGFIPEAVMTDMKETSTWTRYGQSKLANILFTNELVRRYPRITSVSIHPGSVNTNLLTSFNNSNPVMKTLFAWVPSLMATASKGALNQTWASVAPVEGKPENGSKTPVKVQQGKYYVPVAKPNQESAYAKDQALSKKLWEWTEEELQKKGY